MRALLVVIGFVVLVGCGPPGRLNGTIRDRATLGFDEVRAQFLVDRLAISYRDARGIQEVVRLTMPSALAVKGAELDLTMKGMVLEHFATKEDDSGKLVTEPPFPPVKSGTVSLSEVGTARGQLIVGEFHAIFVDSLDTLNGDFSATVVPP